jgi:Calcineurin-like phosphoesterase
MATFVVGDIHGCADEFDDLLKAAQFSKSDRLILAGDLVNKGPDSAGVVARAREIKALSVLGNHDAALIEAKQQGAFKKHHEAIARELNDDDWRYLELLPLTIDLPELNALIVHAGLLPDVPLANQPRYLMLNLRSLKPDGSGTPRIEGGIPWASKWPGPRTVYFGHDAVRGLQRFPFAMGLDTGCVYGKKLTGIWLEENRIVQVNAKRVWQEMDV